MNWARGWSVVAVVTALVGVSGLSGDVAEWVVPPADGRPAAAPVLSPAPVAPPSATPSPMPSAVPAPVPSPAVPLPPAAPPAAAAFAGLPTVGALFRPEEGGSGLGGHFCTASVVHSPGGDLLVTAAHCAVAAGVLFVPDYHDGATPYGVWTVTRAYADAEWRDGADPDHDVAFLTVARAAGGRIEDTTGANRLDTGARDPGPSRVIGYPADADTPITCDNTARRWSGTQLEFDCAGYSDGTSGGPFLAGFDPVSGTGAVRGVIGGHEQGGDSPDVSFSVSFGEAVDSLYQEAVRS